MVLELTVGCWMGARAGRHAGSEQAVPWCDLFLARRHAAIEKRSRGCPGMRQLNP